MIPKFKNSGKLFSKNLLCCAASQTKETRMTVYFICSSSDSSFVIVLKHNRTKVGGFPEELAIKFVQQHAIQTLHKTLFRCVVQSKLPNSPRRNIFIIIKARAFVSCCRISLRGLIYQKDVF